MPDWPNPQVLEAEVRDLRHRLMIAENDREIALEEGDDAVRESWAQAELALEDFGWWRLTAQAQYEFSRAGLIRAAEVCRVAAVVDPLLKRALALRTAYVWGQGISIAARDDDVNAVVQDFLDDPGNMRALHSGKAQELQERTLGTDGNLVFALFTNPLTGKVQVRTILTHEILDVVCNPDDRTEPWFYLRQWSTTGLLPSGSGVGATSVNQLRRAYYPALGYVPAMRVPAIDGIPVMWNAPVLHEKVNELDGWLFGIGDAYAALPFARMYREFLVDWARIAKALSKFTWRLTADRSSKAQAAANKIRALTGDVNTLAAAGSLPAGQLAAQGPGQALEAIPKTGATLDSESGKPLAAMVASAMGVPVTMLLADPGQTGARAVAETLDRPTELEMMQRRDLHKSIRERILNYVIDQAVIATRGPLKGSIRRDGTQLLVDLAGDVERTIDITFPEMTQQDPNQLIAAIVDADGTAKIPPLVIARLLLEAMGVDDVDEILAEMTDENGDFIPPPHAGNGSAVAPGGVQDGTDAASGSEYDGGIGMNPATGTNPAAGLNQ